MPLEKNNKKIHIGIASPITIQEFVTYLDEPSKVLANDIVGLKAPAVDTVIHGFIDEGHFVSVYTLAYEVEDLLILKGEKIKIFISPFGRRGWQKAISLFGKEATSIENSICLEQELPDVLHAHWSYEYALGIKPFRNRIPVIVTVRDWAPNILLLNKNYYRFSRLLLNNRIFKTNSINFLANSTYIRNKIEARWDIIPKIIPNPINKKFQETLKPKQSEFNIISVANGLGRGKNIIRLLEAFKMVLIHYPGQKLVLVGNPFVKSNPQMIKWKAEGLLNNVVLKGNINHDELIALYDQSCLMVHPSLEESFGNTLIEAMARKVPVIGGLESGAVPYVLNHGKCGFLCDVSSSEDIKNAILKVLTDDNLKEDLVSNAYEEVLLKYSSHAVTQKTLNFYKKLIEKAQ